ncbi:MAG TPA: hypothetical protein VMZ30_10250 [Pyrinomonadaceae bacterium]|nr:hypothetical protein [Pyrinomonadaceae bacterium]
MMTIRGDYSWDKTGEPDPEVQELEEILGSLRYQPRPLDIPAGLRAGHERNFFRGFAPRLAIAATIAMLLLGLGLWLGLQRLQRNQPAQLVKKANPSTAKPNPVNESTPIPGQTATVPPSDDPGPQRILGRPRHENQSQLAANTKRGRNDRVRGEQLTAARRQEAEAAKNQLMLAFRMVSAKLNFAQKKAQELNQKEAVHNQHKLG